MNIDVRYLILVITIGISSMLVGQAYLPRLQDEDIEKFKIYSLEIGYGYEFPSGDLADRYGNNLKFTLGGSYTSPSNHVYGIDFNLMFGSNVKEDVLSNLRTDRGIIIGADGGFTDIFLRQRGFYLGAYYAKILFAGDGQSGLRVGLGGGVLSHNIRLLNEEGQVTQVRGQYLKGYDRLTRGLALKPQVGYEYHSKNGRINGHITFELTAGWTNSVREYQFDIGRVPDDTRLDLLYTLRGTWMIPLKRIPVTDKPIYY